jgi:sigma54-dependent transcription regulator
MEVVRNRGIKFAAKQEVVLKDDDGMTKKLIATWNLQANSMVEQVHQVIPQLIHTFEIKGKSDASKNWLARHPCCHLPSCVMYGTRHKTGNPCAISVRPRCHP